MIGVSDDNTPTPFVILAKGANLCNLLRRLTDTLILRAVKLRDPNAYVWNTLQSKTIAECSAMMLRIVSLVSNRRDAL